MNPWRWVDPRVRSVRVDGLRAFLQKRGWVLAPAGNPNFLRFEAPAKNGQKLFQVLPASEQLGDYVQSVTYFLTTMSEVEDRHPVELLEEVLRLQPGAPGRDGNGVEREHTPVAPPS